MKNLPATYNIIMLGRLQSLLRKKKRNEGLVGPEKTTATTQEPTCKSPLCSFVSFNVMP